MSVYKLSNVGGLKNKTAYTSFLAGNSQYFPDMYEAIATTTVPSGGAATVTFSSIPSTYQHLQLRLMTRNTAANNYNSWFQMRVNGDTGSNYSEHALAGNSSAATSYGQASNASVDVFVNPGSDAASGIYGASIIDFLDYANTSKNKTIRILNGAEINVSTTRIGMQLCSAAWLNTSAITSITFTGANGNFDQYSSFALYGIKG